MDALPPFATTAQCFSPMDIPELVQYLDTPEQAMSWLKSLGLEDTERGHHNLVAMADTGMTLDLLGVVCEQLETHLSRLSDPDMALNNLDRYVAASRNPLALGSLFDRDRESLPALLQIFSSSQHLSDSLISDPESFDLLRLTDGHPVAREILIGEICSEVDSLRDTAAIMKALRRYKQRETLRIAYGDLIRRQNVEVVTRQISYLADATCEAAWQSARETLEAQRGAPQCSDGQRARCVVLALGKLGGVELNYSSDIDLVILYEGDGKTEGDRPISNQEFFNRLARRFVKLLAEQTEHGVTYRVDLRLRPDGQQSPIVQESESMLRYYDMKGRTWERQAYVKARPVAGDLELGQEFLGQLKPWIYRRFLNTADITGIKALKRRIEQRSTRDGDDERNVKTGQGGIRDIEFVIQFLQLLNGGDLPKIRTGNTMEAIAALEQAGCLTWQERSILEENYTFLRKLEHRLQIMFDLQTHRLPEDDRELRRVAIRMGCADTDSGTALEQFRAELKTKTEFNRKILDHLLHDAFGDQEELEPESDLVLDPDPTDETIAGVLGRHGFRDVVHAYSNLMDLATEKITFLSTRRCRHFLASIAPRLLRTIATTPDPDATLVNLSLVSESLGGKGALWELFSFNPPSLTLYVQLCASSPYLSGILTSNPGMIDELMDSLLLNKLPTLAPLSTTLSELCRGAEDIDPILHSFKNSEHLRVGVRDILGKVDIQAAHRALSDIAEVCLCEIARREYDRLVLRHGVPRIQGGPLDGQACSLVILALGKLGGREPNYHSDLDLIFVYEAAGFTQPNRPNDRQESTSNQHAFSQLAQRITKIVTRIGPYGRLYELDSRLRPTGKSGPLAVSLDELARYFASGNGQLWERQALCKARPLFGDPEACQRVMKVVRRCVVEPAWQPENVVKIRSMRGRLEETAGPRNLKRGPGGTVDIEFAVQMLQLRHAARSPEVLVPGTLDALVALGDAGHLLSEDAEFFGQSYRLLRSIESGLRLMNTTARHDLPDDESELIKLAYLLGYESGTALLEKCLQFTKDNRHRVNRLFDAASTA
ncbi:MAG TPA: bifunctional [glutamate--ammonia ligase]-adenylyl-L-tyrosine phosphorylase/[glutamate--ammonia-ligase] adenylyltransferase [Pirellulaceae bacterium]|nr:bifunctional [glutamate--ammonia ligase]-adenylyl-L-tyrosine phosphorylase/[glutamate--ammonia-ligase] adenylyltransferase [Pirellulaceae bacterium]